MTYVPATSTASQQPVATLPPGSTASSGSSSTSQSTDLNGVNADTFLQLLVAQLKYQNPDNPTDPTQFLSQTAEFEEVEQLENLQTSLSSLVSAQQAGAATSMLGAQVTGTDTAGNPVTGIVSGVQLTSDGPLLSVGNASVAYSSVTSVTAPSNATGTPGATAGTSATSANTSLSSSSTTGSQTPSSS
jgi:flagellar basal-body rod modification protein FlgD